MVRAPAAVGSGELFKDAGSRRVVFSVPWVAGAGGWLLRLHTASVLPWKFSISDSYLWEWKWFVSRANSEKAGNLVWFPYVSSFSTGGQKPEAPRH